MIEQFYDLRPEVLALDRKALSLCREQFAHVEGSWQHPLMPPG